MSGPVAREMVRYFCLHTELVLNAESILLEREKGVTMSSNKQFQSVPVTVVSSSGDASGFKVNPALVTVFVQGTPDAITQLKAASVQAIVDLSYWDSREELPLPVRIITPPGTATVSISPAEVEVIPPEEPAP